MEIREITYAAIAIRICVAVILGGILGLERGLKNRPAGLRTYMLVCTGSCLIMMTNQYIYQAFGAGDPVRMGAQVVSGIGFLGAGTIVVTKRNQIKGLTTAAGLWAAAAAGLAIGIGFYEAAIMGGSAIFVVLSVIQRWDNRMHQNSKVVELYVELTDAINLGQFMRQIKAMGLEIENIQTEHDGTTEGNVRSYIVVLNARQKRNHEALFQDIRNLEGVFYLEGL